MKERIINILQEEELTRKELLWKFPPSEKGAVDRAFTILLIEGAIVPGSKENTYKAKKTNKYRNVKTEIDGMIFDSKKEGQRYLDLKVLQQSGEISDLKMQVPFAYDEGGKHIFKYLADFTYKDKEGNMIIEDVKSAKTAKLPVYRLKKKLIEARYGVVISEV
ncbi:MAG: DUF1064 domain-containing protein [Spirochaetales bacterium]|nr:DUF1064 domain-containing protein [Spirochaetales bacterium]